MHVEEQERERCRRFSVQFACQKTWELRLDEGRTVHACAQHVKARHFVEAVQCEWALGLSDADEAGVSESSNFDMCMIIDYKPSSNVHFTHVPVSTGCGQLLMIAMSRPLPLVSSCYPKAFQTAANGPMSQLTLSIGCKQRCGNFRGVQ
jgi:hypothetical protein